MSLICFWYLIFFGSDNSYDYTACFPLNLHCWIEKINYVLKGKIIHKDSATSYTINDGKAQFISAETKLYMRNNF